RRCPSWRTRRRRRASRSCGGGTSWPWGPMRTRDWGESWADFCSGWERVRWPARGATLAAVGEGVFSVVPLGNPSERRAGDLLRLGLACEALQQAAGDRPFPLGSRVVAKLLGIHYTTGADLVRILVRAGELVLAVPADRKALRG